MTALTAQADEGTLPEVTVTAEQPRHHGIFRTDASSVSPPATVDIVDLSKLPDGGMDRAEDALRFAGIGSTSTNSAGLGTGINLRGLDL